MKFKLKLFNQSSEKKTSNIPTKILASGKYKLTDYNTSKIKFELFSNRFRHQDDNELVRFDEA